MKGPAVFHINGPLKRDRQLKRDLKRSLWEVTVDGFVVCLCFSKEAAESIQKAMHCLVDVAALAPPAPGANRVLGAPSIVLEPVGRHRPEPREGTLDP